MSLVLANEQQRTCVASYFSTHPSELIRALSVERFEPHKFDDKIFIIRILLALLLIACSPPLSEPVGTELNQFVMLKWIYDVMYRHDKKGHIGKMPICQLGSPLLKWWTEINVSKLDLISFHKWFYLKVYTFHVDAPPWLFCSVGITLYTRLLLTFSAAKLICLLKKNEKTVLRMLNEW